MKNIEYSIVVPVYNESDKIINTLTQILDFMRGFSKNFEILVANDGSTDNTLEIVKKYQDTNPEIKVLDLPHAGKGLTVGAGVMQSNGKYIYMCDADLASPIEELKKLSIWVKEHNYDIVISSREGTGAVRVNEPFYRHFMGRAFNMLVQLFVLPGIKDSQCGFKLFKSGVAKDIFSKMLVYKLPEGSGGSITNIADSADTIETKKSIAIPGRAYLGAFDVEFLYIARLNKYTVKELPVYWKYVRTTRLSPFLDSVKMGFDVLKIFINGMKGAYK